jgi:hypothetical protein
MLRFALKWREHRTYNSPKPLKKLKGNDILLRDVKQNLLKNIAGL